MKLRAFAKLITQAAKDAVDERRVTVLLEDRVRTNSRTGERHQDPFVPPEWCSDEWRDEYGEEWDRAQWVTFTVPPEGRYSTSWAIVQRQGDFTQALGYVSIEWQNGQPVRAWESTKGEWALPGSPQRRARVAA